MPEMRTCTDLMPHQAKCVEKLKPIRVGGLLMEMGTGKTRAAIELVLKRQHAIDKCVWFCPVSLKDTIRREILKHTDTPSSQVYVFDHRTRPAQVPDAFWYVVGIESMAQSDRIVLAYDALVTDRSFVIVDESDFIKGHSAKRTRRITYLSERARYRLILTGTPISQGIVDLFAQMRFLSPEILGYKSFYTFARNHLEYDDKYPGRIVAVHNVPYIAAKIAPYVYQVTKDECLTLPAKRSRTRYFCMTDEQRDAYEEAKKEILLDIESYAEFERIAIFRLFTVLQQIACGFRTRSDDIHRFERYPNERLETLADVIREIPTTEKAVIWSKYRHDIDAIVSYLMASHGDAAVTQFHGGLTVAKRNAEVERFRGPARFLVATPSCGGRGFTLNECRHVVFYSNSFKYAERLQAEDRCHRIGQTEQVTYYDVVCADSIDERILRNLDRKQNTVDAFKAEVDKVKDRSRWKELVEAL